ncbi:MAG: hypothetical protein AB1656_08175 [Candidatus Omnitrophota bacterium]
MKKRRLPKTRQEWLQDMALAYKDASEAKVFGELTRGYPLTDAELFHLAPHVCIKFRGLDVDQERRSEIVEGTLASYVATEDAEGGEFLHKSPLFAFCFCYLAAHYVADLMEEELVCAMMDYCLENLNRFEKLISDSA